MASGISNEADKDGYAITIADATDESKQQGQIEAFISRHVVAILLTPSDSQTIGPAIAEANDARIPVFTVDIASTSRDARVVTHVASNNLQGGFDAGQLMCQAIDRKGDVAVIDQSEVTSVEFRIRGFKEALQQLCPSARIVADVDSDGTTDKAKNATEAILEAHRDLKGIFAINDDSAFGALTVLKAGGFSHSVQVVGYDGTPQAQKAVAKGDFYGDVIQHPDEIGSTAVDVIHQYLGGHKPPRFVKVGVEALTRPSAGP
jgi:ribose transport system substrate-binding protein